MSNMKTIAELQDKIFCGDNVSVLSTFPNECIDLTITSPPYDNIRCYNGYSVQITELATQLYRILKQGGICIWVVQDEFVDGSRTLTSFKQALEFQRIGFRMHDVMMYLKPPQFPGNIRYSNSFEYMFVLSKGEPKTVHLLRDRINKNPKNMSKTVRGDSGKLHKVNTDRCSNVFGYRWNTWLYFPGNNPETYSDPFAPQHPAIFPEELVVDHLLSWSNEGDLVLDPFLGSGTTAKMAKALNRHYVGVEISQEYCTLAEQRIATARIAQTQLRNQMVMPENANQLGQY